MSAEIPQEWVEKGRQAAVDAEDAYAVECRRLYDQGGDEAVSTLEDFSAILARAVLAAVLPTVRRAVLNERVSEMESYSLGVVAGRRAVAAEIAQALADQVGSTSYRDAAFQQAARIAREIGDA